MSMTDGNYYGSSTSSGPFYKYEPPKPHVTEAEALLLADGLLATGASDAQVLMMLGKVGYETQARMMITEAVRQRKAEAPALPRHRAIALDGKL